MDWESRVTAAQDRGFFTDDDKATAQDSSSSAYNEHSWTYPQMYGIEDIGDAFNRAVISDDVSEASTLYWELQSAWQRDQCHRDSG